MNAMTPFSFDGHAVRVVVLEGEPWFVGRDVAEVLGYTNPQKAVRDHCRAPKPVGEGVNDSFTPLDPQTVVLPEPDVLRLIVRSRLPAAERFERWVFEEVLPTIRRTGSYGQPDPLVALSDPTALRTLLLTYSERVIALEQRVEADAPKVAALDRIAGADGTINITEAAKTLQVRPKDLFAWLQQHHWIYRRAGCAHFVAYQQRLQAGLLMHKVTTLTRSDGTEKVVERVLVTAKGLARLAELFGQKVQAA